MAATFNCLSGLEHPDIIIAKSTGTTSIAKERFIFRYPLFGGIDRQLLRGLGVPCDFAQDAIVAYDLEWHVTYWNRSATRIYGWDADEMLGVNPKLGVRSKPVLVSMA